MDKIRNIRFGKCENSMYIKPSRMYYEQNGKEKIWDLMKIHDSVSVVLFNISRKVLIFVKQFRPAVYRAMVDIPDDTKFDMEKYPVHLAMTVESCAGIVDKNASLAEIAREEVFEECGYDAPLSAFHKITSFRSGVGVNGSLQTMFYAEVTDDMCVSKGGGNVEDGELIEVIELSLDEAQHLILDETVARPASMLVGLMWFFQHKCAISDT